MKKQHIETNEGHPNRTGSAAHVRRHFIRRLWLLSAMLLGACVVVALAEEPAGKDLRLFYQHNCVNCHGVDGSALGPDGKKLKGQDLTDEEWRQNTDDKKMVHTILKGKFFGLAMPKFKDALSKDEAQQMVTEIIRKTRKGVPVKP